MRIAIDCRDITGEAGEMAGIGHYTFFLVRHLLRLDDRNRYVLFCGPETPKATVTDLLGSSRNAEVKRLKSSRSGGLPYLGRHRAFAKKVMAERPDIFHAPAGSLPMGYRGKSVVTVHDLAIYLHPEWFPGGQFFSKRVVVPSSLERADRVIAVSRSTKRDLMRRFTLPAEKIAVVHEGVEYHVPQEEMSRKQTLAERYGLDRPYFLYLGTVEPRKNLPMLVKAYVSLAKRFPDLLGDTELLLAGGMGWKTDPTMKAVRKAAKALGTSKARIRHLGYVPAEDKWGLMAEAEAFLFPSKYEGFGLPVLEAMSLGTPTVASETSSIPEITGRDGAILADPEDVTEWVLAMKHLLENPEARADLGARGLARSTEFRWQKAAGETLEIYEEVAKGEGEAHAGADLRRKWIDDTLFTTPHRSV